MEQIIKHLIKKYSCSFIGVELENGNFGVICNHVILYNKTSGEFDYLNGMLDKIERLYKGPGYGTKLSEIFNYKFSECIWTKHLELTIQEIADKFNVPVENLKIKK